MLPDYLSHRLFIVFSMGLLRLYALTRLLPSWFVQSNLVITGTKGTGISIRVIEVSVLNKLRLYMDFGLLGTK